MGLRKYSGNDEMDLNSKSVRCGLLLTCWVLITGCVAPQTPVPTLWQKLGIPQTGARFRDGLVNRRGNFPGLEKKPPVLAIADPANLDPAKPEMIKAAAEIKQDQDLQKQKIKAIKFLAEVNCGCYNKDDKVEAAFLAALEDCDPEVRKAAIEGLDKTAGECARCRNGCEITCCTKKIKDKLEDLASGKEDGCFKEPDPEIRQAAKALFCKCPPIAEDPIEPEELIAPKPIPDLGGEGFREGDVPPEQIQGTEVSYRLSDYEYGEVESKPVVISSTRGRDASNAKVAERKLSGPGSRVESRSCVSNPEQLVKAQAVDFRKALGELLVQMPEAYLLGADWVVVVVDEDDNHTLAKIVEAGGRRLLLTLDTPLSVNISSGRTVRLGLVSKS